MFMSAAAQKLGKTAVSRPISMPACYASVRLFDKLYDTTVAPSAFAYLISVREGYACKLRAVPDERRVKLM